MIRIKLEYDATARDSSSVNTTRRSPDRAGPRHACGRRCSLRPKPSDIVRRIGCGRVHTSPKYIYCARVNRGDLFVFREIPRDFTRDFGDFAKPGFLPRCWQFADPLALSSVRIAGSSIKTSSRRRDTRSVAWQTICTSRTQREVLWTSLEFLFIRSQRDC